MNTLAHAPCLDNPIWHSLLTVHDRFAVGEKLARRFPSEVGPLAGIREQSEEAYQELGELFSPDEPAVLFLDSAPKLPEGWRTHVHVPLDQMILSGVIAASGNETALLALGAADVQEMLELTALTEPGPFRPRTYELGEFWGIRENGHLAAMAGQRLALPGFIEISAVCTHPDFRGRRYSASLVSAMARAIDQRGQTPILHVLPTNAAAISVYESVGFVKRRSFDLTVVFPPSRSA
jgi:ribosomal protein S18 acetylase RimI-like enzyme